jgi:ketosteroid isomerase-like protein
MNNASRLKKLATLSVLVTSLSWSMFVFGHTDDPHDEGDAAPLSATEQAVANVLLAYAQAYATTDIEGIRRLIVDDASFSYFEGAGADSDWADFSAHLAAEMPSFSDARYVFTNIKPEVSGDMGFATFRWTLDVVIISDQFEGGRHPVSMEGLGTAVMLNKKGAWRLRHLHTARKTTSARAG